MGDIRRIPKAERDQYEREQQDPRWLEWLDPKHMAAATDQLLAEVPDMPADPWSREGLIRIERFILDTFPTMDDVDRPENHALADRIARYIGEVFHRLFESKWANVTDAYKYVPRYSGIGPAVTNEWNEFPLAVGNLITAAIDRNTGEYLSRIYYYAARDYPKWVDAGRPPLVEYVLE
jgi:hypothetical protein